MVSEAYPNYFPCFLFCLNIKVLKMWDFLIFPARARTPLVFCFVVRVDLSSADILLNLFILYSVHTVYVLCYVPVFI